jgi:3alpha(or 20beta)-hydroxysteroid dehydrogenase
MTSLAGTSLADRAVIVTGGASGIGAAAVRALHGHGAYVVVGDVDTAAGQALAAELGERARFVELDVAEPEQWSRAVDAALASGLRLGALVNNAGIYRACSLEDETVATMTAVWRVNLLGAALGMQAVLPAMRAAGQGSVVNVSSAAGLRGTPNRAAYASSKWALRGLSKVASGEFGPFGIRVNSIHPGPVATDMMLRSPAFAAPSGNPFASVPLGRAGTPQEVADLIVFLASDQSSFITGAEISVDGGVTAGPSR